MNSPPNLEQSASSSRSKHEEESSFAQCERLSRTGDDSQRPPPDGSWLCGFDPRISDQSIVAQTCPGCCSLCPRETTKTTTKQPRRFAKIDTVTPYQGKCAHPGRSFSQIVTVRCFPARTRTLSNTITPLYTSENIVVKRFHLPRRGSPATARYQSTSTDPAP
jgi:hypothetical protein